MAESEAEQVTGEVVAPRKPHFNPLVYQNRNPWADGLTYRETCFVLAFAGNASEAARAVGISPTTGSNWVKKPHIREAISQRAMLDVAPDLVMGRLEREMLLTAFARDPLAKVSDRIKAIELLGKAQGDFVERKEIAVEHSHAEQLTMSLDERALQILEIDNDEDFEEGDDILL